MYLVLFKVDSLMLEITNTALEHFKGLLADEAKGTGIRLYVQDPGTLSADLMICYCQPGQSSDTDEVFAHGDISFYVEKTSLSYLKDASIDYVTEELTGELQVKAPNLKPKQPKGDLSLHEQIKYYLDHEINPNLAAHKGNVSLVDVVAGKVRLTFSGGCQGCNMAQVTLKQYIDKSLKTKFSAISEVIDITNHSDGKDPYY
jgi:Fe/S biogenesis protein NfuA